MKNTEYKKILLTGGGTGGHLFPAIATAEEFCRIYPNTDVLFVGTKRKMDAKAMAQYGYRSKVITCYGLKGKNIIELVKALAVLPISCLQSLWILLVFRPDLVIGVGGYVTGPVVAMARICGFKTMIHEQNSVPGLANRKLGRLVDKVCVSLATSKKFFPADKVMETGNPVRKNILCLPVKKQAEADAVTVLVLGGSLGATGLNRVVVDAFTGEHANSLRKIKLIHQTGSGDEQWVKDEYSLAGREVICQSFFSNMEEIYSQVDFMISRAGATTLAEISILGKPAILIPFPSAADNHQQKNAEHYVNGGGAMVFKENVIDQTLLTETVLDLANNKEKRELMSNNMVKLGIAKAANNIAKICDELIK
ncbi:MAG: undecaprenyldiphospho-muramoylpentapeptide beta-N-acetylglucosaminyltransferase [Desulfotalea sp.]